MPWNQTTSRITGFLMNAAVWNDEVVENFEFLEEVAYAQFVSTLSPTASSEATASAVVSAPALTYEAVPHLIEFFCPSARPDSTAGALLRFIICDGSTVLGTLAILQAPTSNSCRTVVHAAYRITPSAASHTYNVKVWVSGGTGLVDAGAAGSGSVPVPGFIRIRRVPTG